MRRLARSGRRRRQTPTRPRNDDRPWVHHRGVGAVLPGQTGQDRFRGTRRVRWACCLCGIALVMGFNTGDAALRANGLLTLQKDLFVADGFDPTPTSRVARRAAMAKGPRKVDLVRTLSAERPPVPSLSSVTGIAVKGDVASSLVRLANRIGLTGVIRGSQCDPVPRGQDPP